MTAGEHGDSNASEYKKVASYVGLIGSVGLEGRQVDGKEQQKDDSLRSTQFPPPATLRHLQV